MTNDEIAQIAEIIASMRTAKKGSEAAPDHLSLVRRRKAELDHKKELEQIDREFNGGDIVSE